MSELTYPNLAGIKESATLAMTARGAALRAEGKPVISLSAGEPDFGTPEYIVESAVQAIEEGATHYPPAAGTPQLREAIAAHLNTDYGGCYEPTQVVVSVGAKQALFNALFALFGPGDRVVIPAPYWVSYPAMVHLARAEPVIVDTTAETGFKLTVEQLESVEGARAVILCSPSNPTGSMYSEEEIAALVEVAERRGIWILSDEIYSEIRYGKPFASVARYSDQYERVILVNGFSKAYAMTGWRVGYAAATEPLVRAMVRLQGHINTNTALPSMRAAEAALADESARREAIDTMVSAFERRRTALLEGMAGIPGLEILPPDGAFYLWMDAKPWCDAVGGGSSDLCLDLLDQENVGLVPGSAFGTEGHLRLSFAASDEDLSEATERLKAAAVRLGVGN
jgi:aspartate/methionine/tyrosine aminotransferase